MKYQIILPKKVQKELDKIKGNDHQRLFQALIALASDPYIGKKLIGNRKGQWSFRVWPFRIIYEINNQKLIVFVIKIGSRQGVYK